MQVGHRKWPGASGMAAGQDNCKAPCDVGLNAEEGVKRRPCRQEHAWHSSCFLQERALLGAPGDEGRRSECRGGRYRAKHVQRKGPRIRRKEQEK
eukprot:1158273-Pelagomonas_calceolata.AAC.8